MTLEQQHKIEDALNRDLTPEEIAIIDDDLTGDYEVDDIVELILADQEVYRRHSLSAFYYTSLNSTIQEIDYG